MVLMIDRVRDELSIAESDWQDDDALRERVIEIARRRLGYRY